jgi:serine/threonine protein kinase
MRYFYVFQLCSALKKVHEMYILHRDLKPQNFLLARNRKEKLLLADFGGTKDE